jgi:hypothetical protein
MTGVEPHSTYDTARTYLRASTPYQPPDVIDIDGVYHLLEQLRPEWQHDGLCGPDLNWWPARGDTFKEQLALCGRCPVRQQCLDYALADPTLEGIWGGTSHKARKQMRRQQRAVS